MEPETNDPHEEIAPHLLNQCVVQIPIEIDDDMHGLPSSHGTVALETAKSPKEDESAVDNDQPNMARPVVPDNDEFLGDTQDRMKTPIMISEILRQGEPQRDPHPETVEPTAEHSISGEVCQKDPALETVEPTVEHLHPRDRFHEPVEPTVEPPVPEQAEPNAGPVEQTVETPVPEPVEPTVEPETEPEKSLPPQSQLNLQQLMAEFALPQYNVASDVSQRATGSQSSRPSGSRASIPDEQEPESELPSFHYPRLKPCWDNCQGHMILISGLPKAGESSITAAVKDAFALKFCKVANKKYSLYNDTGTELGKFNLLHFCNDSFYSSGAVTKIDHDRMNQSISSIHARFAPEGQPDRTVTIVEGHRVFPKRTAGTSKQNFYMGPYSTSIRETSTSKQIFQ